MNWQGWSRRDVLLGAAGSVASLSLSRNAFAKNPNKWETITREQAILVSTRVEPGRQFPSFRGIGRVNGSVWEVLAILADADRHMEWMHQCNGSKLIKAIDDSNQIIYNRTDAPWPVKDRDVVLRSNYAVAKEGKDIWSRFKQTRDSSMGPVDGVVRMPTLTGRYHLVSTSESQCLVEYRVNADPGGSLPDWVVTQTTKDLPLHTLINLRARVKKMSGTYDLGRFRT